MRDRKILILAGPTAVGKTEYSLELAKLLDGEIVSADSMQLYKYMDIGSAKPTKEEMAQAVHHMVDEIDPREEFSVFVYSEMAKKAIEDIFSRGKTPIISGGTGLYINSLIYKMDFSAMPDNKEGRKKLENIAETKGKEALHAMLKEKDPKAAERIHPNNVKKVIRALEMLEEGQGRVREFSESFVKTDDYDHCFIGLYRDREELYDRINKRVDILMDMGLLEEIKMLDEMGLTEEHISMKGIGYKELFGYLREEYDLEEAVYLIKRNTRHYAKRQMTWLRRYEDINWINLSEKTKDEALEDILKCWRGV
ncbi:MAG: tRNA (adenosine(37)-N6)-dimethylallyltransferase MiaA [Clostridiales bacterium]|nr:tRNA (adenosine(37)-N6)-dimethylallyltransferase MiaA [Clostridiales bacterium]